MPAKLDIKQFLAAGVHFGHSTSRWHPKMAPYLHSKQGGRYIIDLQATLQALETALAAVTKVVAGGKQVLLVGTKLQARPIIQAAAQATGMPFVNQRWLGGMLTNQQTINVQVKKLKQLETRMESGELAHKYSKLEVQKYQKQIDNLNRLYGGVKTMTTRPGLVFITDMRVNAIAVAEATKLKLPTVALADSNVDPSLVTHPIPANDDALKSLALITDLIVEAIKAGQAQIKPEGQ